jgi:hypothetical protein
VAHLSTPARPSTSELGVEGEGGPRGRVLTEVGLEVMCAPK